MEDNQPKGIGFFNVKTGETRYAQLEPQIMGYINSSDMGINASRGQDFDWRLAEDWVKKVKIFRRNEVKMETLTNRNGGQKVTQTQILYAIYGEQLRAAQEQADENERPFEEGYLQRISGKPSVPLTPDQIDPEDGINDMEIPEEEAGHEEPDPTDIIPSTKSKSSKK